MNIIKTEVLKNVKTLTWTFFSSLEVSVNYLLYHYLVFPKYLYIKIPHFLTFFSYILSGRSSKWGHEFNYFSLQAFFRSISL